MLSQDSIDVLQQRIERGRRPACTTRPSHRSKPRTNVSFRLRLEVVHQFENHRGTRALADGIPGAEDRRRPRVVAVEHRCGNERDQRVRKRVPVLEVPDAGEALTESTRSPHRRSHAAPRGWREHTIAQRQEPRTGLSQHWHGLDRAGVPPGRCRRRQGRLTPSRSAHSRCPTKSPATGTPLQRDVNRSRAAVKLPSACSTRADRSSAYAPCRTSPRVAETEGARRARRVRARVLPACTSSTAAPTSAFNSAAGGRARQIQNLLTPLEAFGRVPPNQPEIGTSDPRRCPTLRWHVHAR